MYWISSRTNDESSGSNSDELGNQSYTNIIQDKQIINELFGIDALQDIEGSPSDIPTFDGAEFSEEKPKSKHVKGIVRRFSPPWLVLALMIKKRMLFTGS